MSSFWPLYDIQIYTMYNGYFNKSVFKMLTWWSLNQLKPVFKGTTQCFSLNFVQPLALIPKSQDIWVFL